MKNYATIYTTTNYEKFKFINGNRKLNKRNLAKLVTSMNEEQLTMPICVNKNYYIIDGQHRYEVCKELGLPIYFYIEPEYDIEQVKRANLVSSTWKKEDFLNMHIEDGLETYNNINEVLHSYEIKISDFLRILGICQKKNTSILSKQFEDGTISIGNIAEVTNFLDRLEIFNFFGDYKSKSFITAFLKLNCHELYDHERMVQRLKTRKTYLKKTGSADQYLMILTKDIYSFGVIKTPLYYDAETKRFYN